MFAYRGNKMKHPREVVVCDVLAQGGGIGMLKSWVEEGASVFSSRAGGSRGRL
jgi:hypothetical protein